MAEETKAEKAAEAKAEAKDEKAAKAKDEFKGSVEDRLERLERVVLKGSVPESVTPLEGTKAREEHDARVEASEKAKAEAAE